jgi:NADH-quinone oxidoreductase subunit A
VDNFWPALVLLAGAVAALAGLYALSALVGIARQPLLAPPFLSGLPVIEHAVSRYHVRWYTVTMVFLAFDMEMVFMYPWVLVVVDVGAKAVVEMFIFLGLLMAGVVYAWREGALRWT